MAGRKPPSEAALVRAAELRTIGMTWEQAAEDMQRSQKTICRWPQMYPDRWRQALVKGRQQALAALAGESFGVLRGLLETNDNKIRLAAARVLASLLLQQARLDLDAPREEVSESARFIAHILETYTDEQLRQLCLVLRKLEAEQGARSPGLLAAGAA
jgi:hypothetical protein